MLIFKEHFSYINPFHIVFLCGSKYSKDTRDKRNVLKRFIEHNVPNGYAIILEENFFFGRTNRQYLSYDDIFLNGLAQVEQLASMYADKIIIIHETISTGAEVGMFASDPALASKICLLVPDPFTTEEDKTGNFIALSFLRKQSPETQVKRIRYYPDTEIHKISVHKSDYRTFFHGDQIGRFLGDQIISFLAPVHTRKEIFFRKPTFGNAAASSDEIDYRIFSEGKTVYVDIHAEALKIQLLSLLFAEPVRKQLRKEKWIREHITYLFQTYRSIVFETVKELEGQSFDGYRVKLRLKNGLCGVKEAIGYFLYMLQAAGLIGLEQKTDAEPAIRKVRFKSALEQYKDQFAPLIYESVPTEFGRLTI